MADEESVAQIIKDFKLSQGNNSSLHERMDNDMRLITDNFELKYPDTNEKVPEIHNVTSSQALIDFLSALGDLASVSRQIDINGEMGDTQRALRAEFFDELFISVDEFVSREFGWEWSNYIDQLLLMRGGIDARILLREQDGEFVPDILPVDIRYREMKKGKNGLIWWTHYTERDVDVVKEEYPEVTIALGKGGKVRKTVPVHDHWSPEKHIVIVDGSQDVVNEVNPYAFVPAVSQGSGWGLKLAHDDATKHNDESVFWENRNLYEVESEFMTIARNTHLDLFRPTTVGRSTEPGKAGPEIDRAARYGIGKHAALPANSWIERMLQPDTFNLASTVHRDLLIQKLSRGGTNDLDLGNQQGERSRFQITDQSQKKQKKLRLPLKAKALFMRQVCRMVVMELEALKFKNTLRVGEIGSEREYRLKQIMGKYSIAVNYSIKDPVQDLVNIETAMSQKQLGYSDDHIGRVTLGFEDFDAEKQQRTIEMAERSDPLLALFNLALYFIERDEEGDDEKAKLVEARLLPMIKQLAMSGQMNPNLMAAMQQQGRPQQQPQGVR